MKVKKILLLTIMLLAGTSLLANKIIEFNFDSFADALNNNAGNAYNAQSLLLDKYSFVQGVKGMAMSTSGNGEGMWVDLKKNPTLEGAVTMSFFFRPDYFGHFRQMTLVSFWEHPRQLMALKINNNRLCAMDWSDFDNRISRHFGEKLEIGRWYHIIWQITGKEWNFYVDGKLALSMPTTTTIDSHGAHKLLLANDYNHAVSVRDHFCGLLDEFKLESGLTAPETFAEDIKLLSQAPAFTGHNFPGAANIKADENVIISSIDPTTQSFIFDGARSPVMMYAGGDFDHACDYVFETAPDAFKTGMKVFRIGICPRDFKHGEWWIGPDQYDFEGLDLFLDMLFRKEPNAYMLLQIPISPPTWWGRMYPEEETAGFNGQRVRDYKASHSFSSRKWLEDTEKAYKAFFDHFKTTPYYKRTIGYVTVIGRYNEAFRWGYNGGYTQLTDYSKPELLGFQAYLQRRYSSVEVFNATRPAATAVSSFDQVQLPTPDERMKNDGYFVDPVRERNVIDYRMYLNANHAEKIGEFTNIIRKFTGPDTIMGLYYGYVFSDSHGHGRTFSNESGHYGLAAALRHSQIDFFLDSMSHVQREIGNAGPTAGAPAANALHGKLWLDEADIRTHIPYGRAEYSGAKNVDESLAVLWRSFGTIQVNGSGLWWFPIAGQGAYSHPRFWDAFSVMYKEMEYTAANPPKTDRANTVAIIMDSPSLHFRHYSKNDPVCGNLITGLLGPIAKAGFAYDIHLIEDIELIPDEYKTYIFINSFYLSEHQRNIIKERFAKNNNLLVFTYAGGYFTGDDNAAYSCDVKNISQLTNMNIALCSDRQAIPQGQMTAAFGGQNLQVDPKTPSALYPLFYVNDPSVKPLAVFSNTTAGLNGKTALAIKDCGNYRSAYIGIPVWTPELLRTLAQLGGTHVYSQDPPTYVLRPGNGHILLHTANAVSAKIILPRKVKRVYDVTNNRELGSNCSELQVQIPNRSTVYLRIEE